MNQSEENKIDSIDKKIKDKEKAEQIIGDYDGIVENDAFLKAFFMVGEGEKQKEVKKLTKAQFADKIKQFQTMLRRSNGRVEYEESQSK